MYASAMTDDPWPLVTLRLPPEATALLDALANQLPRRHGKTSRTIALMWALTKLTVDDLEQAEIAMEADLYHAIIGFGTAVDKLGLGLP